MKVLTLTTLFPNRYQPTFGVFNLERIRHLTRYCEVRVIAPVPFALPIKIGQNWNLLSKIPRYELLERLRIYHPRLFVIPKIGRPIAGLLYLISVFNSVKKISSEFDFDLLDVHWAYPDGWAGARLSKLLKKPMILTVHGTDIHACDHVRYRRILTAGAMRGSHRIIAVSNNLKKKVSNMGIPDRKIKFIPNGVDARKFRPVDRLEARKALGLPADKKILLSVGNLVDVKAFDRLIQTIPLLLKKNHDVYLVIIGEGELAFELERQARELNIRSVVKLAGRKPHNELYMWYCASDLFCLFSKSEGWPTVLFEALACQIPVVATPVGGIPEIIHSREFGILASNNNPAGFAEVISKALSIKWQYKKLRDYAVANSWDDIAKKIYSVYANEVSLE